MLSRRDVLRAGLSLAVQTVCPSAGPAGELLGIVPFAGGRGPAAPFGEIVGGRGLDARRFTDLSDLAPDRIITPTDRVFVRTTAPAGVAAKSTSWAVDVGGLADRMSISLAQLTAAARSMGAHVIECAGNTDPRNFGLMSVAEWDGVPLVEVVLRLRPSPKAVGIRISGVDHDTQTSLRSLPGASWVLPLADLERLDAFLAVRMNGAPLPLDHGAPVRLVVAGWYGCAWIKWVNGLHFVGADEPATPQMLEFAARTHQQGVPRLAREYEAPAIDLAATPVRIEKRRLGGRLFYRIVGIVWGGARTTGRLLIRFHPDEPFTPFDICPPARTHRVWSLWEHRWRPAQPGMYDIVLRAADPAIRTRRLDLFAYARRVFIDEV